MTPNPGNPWLGGLAAILATALVHASSVAIAMALQTPLGPGAHGNFGPLILAFNPMCTLLAWAPIAAFFLRRRRGLLRGFLIGVGLVILLNTACWGVIAVNG